MTKKQKDIRKLFKVGGDRSYAITLPIEMIRELKWQEKQKLEIEFDPKKQVIKIKDWEK